MDVENLAKELILKNMTPEQQMAVLDSVRQSVAQAKEVQKRKIGENVDLVVQALKKIESDIRSRFDDVGNAIEKRVASIKDGRDGIDGKDGRDGKDGKSGRDGAKGDKGDAGRDGRDGVDGTDGVSVTSARIDFDGSLVITLSSGVELNVGEVVAPDLAERIKVITNGGGTSQSVLDTLDSLQDQIDTLIPSQTGNSGKFLTTNGTSTSWASVAGGLSYQGTWNASTNTPTLASSTGTNGYYYIVATAGSTNLNGVTDWGVGDWAIYNGTAWQKIDQSETLQFVTSADGSVTVTTTGATADLAVYTSPRVISQVRNETGATLTKGTVVYISGASGNKATVSKAICTSDATSAQTFGLIFADISNNNNGYAILSGDLAGLDTSAFAAGTQLYLSPTTAGAYTSTKQYAPNHLVYIGVVTRSHVNQGSIEVRIQNGYEMDELHNVSAQSPSNGQTLVYNTSTSLWETSDTFTSAKIISVTDNTNAALRITQLGTGNALLVEDSTNPDSTPFVIDASGKVVIGNTTTLPSPVAYPLQVVGSGSMGMTLSRFDANVTAPIAAFVKSRNATIGTFGTIVNSGDALGDLRFYGDDGVTAIEAARISAQVDGTPSTNDMPCRLVFSTTADGASTVTERMRITSTGAIAFSGASNYGTSGQVLTSSGNSAPTWSTISASNFASQTANYVLAAPDGSSGVPTFRAVVAADIPTLNQNTTGTASNVTGTVAVANGGTGQTSYTNGQLLIGNTTGNTLTKATLSAGTGISITNGTGSISIASTVTGTVTSVAATVPSFLSISGSPITTSGTLAISYSGTALPVANGGTGVTTSTGSGAVVLGTSPTLTTPTINSAQVATVSGTAPLYMCRAWVNFNGTGTVAIRGSGNVSSITDNGVGDYTVNFTTAMPDANYSTTALSSTKSGTESLGIVAIEWTTVPSTTVVRITTVARGTGSGTDCTYNNVAIFR
jgi:hypothetical protein